MRIATKGALVGSAAFGLMVAMGTTAHATHYGLGVYNSDGWLAGSVWFADDPSGDDPGDAIKACDRRADGWGIVGYLDIWRDGSVDRWATTQGFAADYCTPWETGNIEEGTPINFWGCMIKGSERKNCTEKSSRTA